MIGYRQLSEGKVGVLGILMNITHYLFVDPYSRGQILKEKLIRLFGHARNLSCCILRQSKSKNKIRFGQEEGLSSGL